MDVVITGVGVVCAVAHDSAGLLEAVERGRCGIRPVRRFDTSQFRVHLGAEVPDWPCPERGDDDLSGRLCLEFSLRAAREALASAESTRVTDASRVGLVFGTGLVDGARPVHLLARRLADELGLRGPSVTVSTACSSSTGAIGLARELLVTGAVDSVLAGGGDVLTESVFAGFHALGVLSPEPCAPFSTPFGTTLGEGAGFVVLERRPAALARGVPVLATVSGFGLSADAFHETSPDPKGSGVARALRMALDDAGIAGGEIGYVNAHGSGTASNDASEWRGIERGLGSARAVPVSSTKGALGHAQGAAGVLESIVTIMTMNRGMVAPTLNFAGSRRYAPPDPVGGVQPRPVRYRHAVCLNSAFGGANAALVLSTPHHRPKPAPPLASLEVRGVGVVGAFGVGTEAFREAGEENPRGRVPPFDLAETVPREDPRGLDPSSRYLIAASALALRDAGVTVRGDVREGTGLVVGAIRASPESVAAFGASVDRRGLAGLSAAAFARIVLNAPAGFCSKALSLRGPHTALATGAGSGLTAVAVSAELLATRSRLCHMLGAAVDEVDPEDAQKGDAEGAACVLLSRHTPAPQDSGTDGAVLVTGWGMAGPHDLGRAMTLASRGAAVDYDLVVDATTDEQAPSSGGVELATPCVFALVRAVLALRRGDARRAIVTSSGGSVSVAVALSA